MTDPGKLVACGLLPIELVRCPCCGGGVKPSRGFTWINPEALTREKRETTIGKGGVGETCPMEGCLRCWEAFRPG